MTAPDQPAPIWEDEGLLSPGTDFIAKLVGCDLVSFHVCRAKKCRCREDAINFLRALSPHLVRRARWPDDVAPRPLCSHLWYIEDANGIVFARIGTARPERQDGKLAAAIVAAVNASMGDS